MKKTILLLSTTLLVIFSANAKTYKLGSGKWSDASVWGGAYMGSTISEGDEVIVTGQMCMNTSIVVKGTLRVEKGAGMVGMKDLMVTSSGMFINDGNTVVKRIMNQGRIHNNMIMEAMMEIDNNNLIENNNVVTGSSFNNFGGNATGKNGAYYIGNSINASPASNFGKEVKVFSANINETSAQTAPTISLNAKFDMNSVVLSTTRKAEMQVAQYIIEKSTDGTNYELLNVTTGDNQSESEYTLFTDNNLNEEITYYRVKAIGTNGNETQLPIATVKASSGKLFSMAN